MPPYFRVIEPSACLNASKIARLLFRRDADARVRHGKPQLQLALDVSQQLNGEDHFALLGELYGVAHQIDDDLPQTAGIAHNASGTFGVDLEGQLEPFLVAREGSAVFMVSPRQSPRLKSIASISSLPASIFEKSRMSLIRESKDSADILAKFRYSRCSEIEFRIEHQLRHADDAVHGRADFVAHVGQELALGPVGGFGVFLGPMQIRFGLLSIGDVDVDADDPADVPVFIKHRALRSRQLPQGAVGPDDAEVHTGSPVSSAPYLFARRLPPPEDLRVNRLRFHCS